MGEPRTYGRLTRKDRILAAVRRGPCTFAQLSSLIDAKIGNLLMDLQRAGLITKIDGEWYVTNLGRNLRG